VNGDTERSQFPQGDFRAPLPVINPGHSYGSITDKLTGLVLTRHTPLVWFGITGIAFLLLMGLMLALTKLLFTGIGIWGNNVPVGWAFDIINFVWWIGIGHAGTLISAILLLFKQDWRTSINRFAEAMTLFAVACAAIFPLVHTGRPWLAIYWLFPYPNTMGLWPNFRSPLIWDVFAVTTYASVSAIFWFIGLIPDLATFRDKTKSAVLRRVFGLAAMGWRGSAIHWTRYEKAYLLLAGLSTPLVLSVHTVVSFDFAVSVLPGWHATIFPPYFVAGAIYAGFAMVLTLAIPLRAIYRLHDFITMRHIENMAKITLVTGLIVVYGYACEAFFGWYSGNEYERFMLKNRIYYGPMSWSYWLLLICNFIVPQILWSKRMRRNLPAIFIVCMFVNVGMWLERFVIIVTSLHRDFVPSSWEMYWPTMWDFMTLFGTIGLFTTLMFVFVRVLPLISIFEMRTLLPEAQVKPPAGGGVHGAPAVPEGGSH
jgi:Ni/Fe-hydrogenase subunit HybB-like protein